MTKETLEEAVSLHNRLEELKDKISSVEFRLKNIDLNSFEQLENVKLPPDCAVIGLQVYLNQLNTKFIEIETLLKDL